MKIYNRKGFAWGLLWTVLSGWLLIHSVLAPEPEPERQIKNIVVGIILLLVGLNGLSRAFSRKASREDYIEEKDERNQLLALKVKARTLDVMMVAICILVAAGVAGYILTGEFEWSCLAFGPFLLTGVYWISGVVISVHYERRS